MFILKKIWNYLAKHYHSLLNEQKFKDVSKLKIWHSELIFGIFILYKVSQKNAESLAQHMNGSNSYFR